MALRGRYWQSRATAKEIRHTSLVDDSGRRGYVQKGGGLVEAVGRQSTTGIDVVMLEQDEVKVLVQLGQEAGSLTHEQVAVVLEELGADPAQADALYQALEELQIEVVDEAATVEVELDLSHREMSTDALQLFLKDIGRVPLLTAAQEVELAKRIERGDDLAKRQMVESNLRLVVSIA